MTTVARWGDPLPLFCKCVKRKGFKSFVLKVCETKGVADAFFGKCVNLRDLEENSLELKADSQHTPFSLRKVKMSVGCPVM